MLTQSVLHSLFKSEDSKVSCIISSILWAGHEVNKVHQAQCILILTLYILILTDVPSAHNPI